MSYCALDTFESWLRSYFLFPNDHCVTAYVLWCAHVRLMGGCEVTPRIIFESPEPGSGKTNLLRVTSYMCGAEGREGIVSASVSGAVLARGSQSRKGEPEISTWGADLVPQFIDEVDKKYVNATTEDVTTTEVLNGGFSRGAVYERMGGKDKDQVKRFGIFGAVAMAGINSARIPDALRSRTISIPMDRAVGEQRKHLRKFRERTVRYEYKQYRDELAEWCQQAEGHLDLDAVQFPDGLSDRDEDCWEILLAIASVAGRAWLARGVAAAKWFASRRAEETSESRGILMLRDCAELLKEVRSSEPEWLRRELVNKDGSPWQGWNLTTYQMKRTLARYQIKPATIRLGTRTAKGYHAQKFEDALLKYECGIPLETGHNGHIFDNKNNSVTNVSDFQPPQGDGGDFEERAAILEFDGGLSREEADAQTHIDLEIPDFLRRSA